MHCVSSVRRVAMAAVVLVCVACCSPAWAQGTYSVIFNFNANRQQGWDPWSGLVIDHGNLIGTTEAGGAIGLGAVYEMLRGGDGTWSYVNLYSFTTDLAGAPTTTPVMDQNRRIYGTGEEFIYQLNPKSPLIWYFIPVYQFMTGEDGDCGDLCSVSLDSSGNLYGSTPMGGAYGAGVIFKALPGAYTVLYTFTGGSDGKWGQGKLAFDSQGNIYGTAAQGGAHGGGVAYRLSPTADPTTWVYTVLHSFGGSLGDGTQPAGGLIMGSDGNLYGTTVNGGTGLGGTAFRMKPNGDGTWTENVIHPFRQNLNDGFDVQAAPTMDSAGNLWGTTVSGGGSRGSYGTVYKLTPSGAGWTETIVHVFQGGPNDGMGPFGPVAIDSSGNVFGTTLQGGKYNNWGTVWEITP